MAYTIISAPAGSRSMHMELYHVVNSSNKTQPDFRYVMDVYVGASLAVRLKIAPEPVNGYGVVDVSRVIRAYLTNYFAFGGAAPYALNTNGIKVDYTVDYGEEYSGTLTMGLATNTYDAYNTYVGDYVASNDHLNGLQKKWITDRDIENIYISRTQNAFIPYWNDSQAALQIKVYEIDEDGFAVVPGPSGIHTTTLSASLGELVLIDLKPSYISGSPFSPGYTIPSTAAGYRLQIVNSDGPDESDWITIWMKCEPKIPLTMVHFLNRYGGYDSFGFAGPTRKAVMVDRRMYRDQDNDIQYVTNQKWTRKLSSGFLDDDTHDWLNQLVLSPEVYVEIDGGLQPVTIVTQQWTEKLNRFDRMYNLDLEVKMGRNPHSQSRS